MILIKYISSNMISKLFFVGLLAFVTLQICECYPPVPRAEVDLAVEMQREHDQVATNYEKKADEDDRQSRMRRLAKELKKRQEELSNSRDTSFKRNKKHGYGFPGEDNLELSLNRKNNKKSSEDLDRFEIKDEERRQTKGNTHILDKRNRDRKILDTLSEADVEYEGGYQPPFPLKGQPNYIKLAEKLIELGFSFLEKQVKLAN